MKVKFAFFFAFLMLIGFTGISFSSTSIGPVGEMEYTLYAGQNMDVGKVIVNNDSDYVYVKFEITNWIGLSLKRMFMLVQRSQIFL